MVAAGGVHGVSFRDKDEMTEKEDLATAVRQASGADVKIDRAIARLFGVAEADYSSSVEQCRALAGQLLPDWRLHVGYGASGVFPYASLTRGDAAFEADAPTLPLAVLRVLFDSPLPKP